MKQIDIIYNMFLHKINDPDILEYYTEEEMQLDCDMSIRMVLGKLVYFDIDYDDTIICTYEGYCHKCKTEYTWIEEYRYHHRRNLEIKNK